MTKEKFSEIIVNSRSSYKFLGAEQGYWLGVEEDGTEKTYSISEMRKDYRVNCINYLNRQKENIERGYFLQGVDFDKADYDELVQLGCDAMKQKIWELSQ